MHIKQTLGSEEDKQRSAQIECNKKNIIIYIYVDLKQTRKMAPLTQLSRPLPASRSDAPIRISGCSAWWHNKPLFDFSTPH